MPKFRIEVLVSFNVSVEVEAPSLDKAIDMAEKEALKSSVLSEFVGNAEVSGVTFIQQS